MLLTAPTNPSASITSTSVTGCNGACNGSISVNNPTGGSGSYEFSINGGGTWQVGNVFSNLCAGTYSVMIRSAGFAACAVTLNGALTLTQPPVFTGTTTITHVTCNGGNDGRIVVNNMNPPRTYEYSINGGAWQLSNTFTGLTAGSYSVAVRDQNNQTCVAVINPNATITQPTALSATPTLVHVTACYGNTNGSITFSNPTGGSGSYSFSINGGVSFTNTATFSNLAAGTYTLVIRNRNTPYCATSLGTVIITEPIQLNATVAGTNVTPCNGRNNGTITISGATGGSGSYQFSIDNVNWTGNANFTSLLPGTYTVRMRDQVTPACVRNIGTITITQPGVLTASASGTNVTICNGLSNGSISINNVSGGTPPYEYSIDDGANWSPNAVFNNLSAGTYRVRIRLQSDPTCNSLVNGSLILTQPAPLSATISSTNINCFGGATGTITVANTQGGSGQFEFSIDGGTSYQPTGSFTGLPAGTYGVVVRDRNNPTCFVTLNGALTLTEATQLNATASGVDVSNCSAPNGQISLTAISGGSGSYEFSIDGGVTWFNTINFTGLSAGTYTVRIRDANIQTCVRVLGSVTILAPTNITATVTPTNVTLCNGRNNGSIVFSNVIGGSGVYQYSINGGNGPWSNSNTFNNLAPGSYTASVRDANNPTCVYQIANITITEPTVLSASIQKTDVSGCFGLVNGAISVINQSGGVPPYEYSIDGGANWQLNSVFSNLGAGTYDVRIRNQSDPTCFLIINANVNVTQPTQISANVTTSNPSCFGGSNGTITFINVAGGSGQYQYTIDNGGNWVNTPSFSGLVAGSYNVQVRDRNNPTCILVVNANLSLTQPALLNALATETDIADCANPLSGQILISNISGGSGQYEFSIDDGLTWNNSTLRTGLGAGTYVLRVRDALDPACERIMNSVTIDGIVAITALVSSVDVTICNGRSNGSITISNEVGGSGFYEYSIDGGASWFGNQNFPNIPAAMYDVRIRDAHQHSCMYILNSAVLVSQPAPITATLSTIHVTGCSGNTNGSITVLNPNGGMAPYEFSIDGGVSWQTSPTFNNLSAGSYDVRVRNQGDNSCLGNINGNLLLTEPVALGGSATGVSIACFGGLTGSITLQNVVGGSGIYEYSINGGVSWSQIGTFTGLGAGVYNVVLRDRSHPSCSFVVNPALTLTESSQLNATLTGVDVTHCTTPNGSVTVTSPTGGSGSYEYSLDGGTTWTTNVTTSGLSAGSYSLTIRDRNVPSCVRVLNTVVLNAPVPITATVSGTSVSGCHGRSNGSIVITNVTGGSGNYEYTINGGVNWFVSPSFTNLSAGIYIVRIRDYFYPTCNYTINGNLTISQPAPLSATVIENHVTGCNGNSNGSILLSNPQGGTPPYEYSINGGISWQPGNSFTGLIAGVYTTMLRNQSDPSCVVVLNQSLQITQPTPLSANLVVTNISCFGSNTGRIQIINTNGGSGTYEYTIDGGATWSDLSNITGLLAGIYNVSVRDFYNPTCILVLNPNQTISEPAQLNTTVITAHVTDCNTPNGSFTFTNTTGGSGVYEFSIDGGVNWSSNASRTGLIAGNYAIMIRDQQTPTCIRNLGTVTINPPTPIVASATKTDVTICRGRNNGTISITASGGTGNFDYSIDAGSTWSSNPVFGNLIAGSYNVWVRDALNINCWVVINSNLILTEPAHLNATAAKTDVTGCFGNTNGSITVQNPTGGYGTYEFSIDGGNSWSVTPSFTGLTSGIYDVRVRSAGDNLCFFIINPNLTVTQPQQMSAVVSKMDVNCFGTNTGSIQVSNVQPLNITFQYSVDGINWQQSGVFNGLSAGSYTVQIRDANNISCVRILNNNYVLTEPNQLTVNFTSQNVTSCALPNGLITFSNPNGGSGSYEFSVNGGQSWSNNLNFQNLIAGSYQLQIRDSNEPSCSRNIGTITINPPVVLTGSISTLNVLGCNGRSNGSITITASGGAGVLEFSINGGNNWSNNPSFTGLSAATYSVQVRDQINPSCVLILNPNLILTQPLPLNATVTVTPVTGCNGNNNGIISITNPVGGSGTYEYSIDGGNTWSPSGTFTGLTGGTYVVRIQNLGDPSCSALLNGNLVITQPPQISGNYSVSNVTCFGGNDGQINFVNITPIQFTYEYSIDAGLTWLANPLFTGLSAGTYNLRVRNANFINCVQSFGAVNLTQPTQLNGTVTATNVTTCTQAPNGTINISNVSGGSGQYEYSINGGVTYSSQNVFTQLNAGTYNVYIRDANQVSCNRLLGSYVITAPATLNDNVNFTHVSECNGNNDGTITLTNVSGGNGTYQYSIDGGVTWTANASFTNLAAGSFDVRIRDGQYPQCFVILNPGLVITQPAVLTATVLETDVTGCAGNTNGNITITNPRGGSGLYEFSIDGGNVWQTSPIFTNLAAGDYYVHMRNQNLHSCSEFLLMVQLTEPLAMTATLSTTNLGCPADNSGSIVLSNPRNGSGTYEYSIDGGVNWLVSGVFNNLPAGTYNVQIRDAINPSCVAIVSANVTLTQPTVMAASVVTTNVTVCVSPYNGTMTISNPTGGRGSYQFSIDGGLTWTTQTNYAQLLSGNYSVRMRNSNPPYCEVVIATPTILGPTPITSTVSKTDVTGCYGNTNGQILITATTGGSGNYQYSIDGGQTWPYSGLNVTVNGLSAGNYFVIVRDANAHTCQTVLNNALQITQPGILNASALAGNVTCYGNGDGTISFNNPTGGSGSYEYSVDGGATWQSNATFTALPAGNYNVSVRDQLNPTCVRALSSVSITQPGLLNASYTVTNVVDCAGNSNGMITFSNLTGGSGSYELSIDGGVSWQTNLIFNNLSAGNYNIYIRDRQRPLCIRLLQANVPLIQPNPLSATIQITHVTGCNGNTNGSINIVNAQGGSGQYEFSINGGINWQQNPSFTGLGAGFYDVRMRDRQNHACTVSLNVNVQIIEPGLLSGTATAQSETGCAGNNNGSITITNVSGGSGTYYFTINGGLSWVLGQTIFIGLTPGTYTVRMRDAADAGCLRTINSNLIILPVSPITGNATSTNATCFGGNDGTITVSNISGGSGSYEYSVLNNTWQNSPTFSNLVSGTYAVRVRDAVNPSCTVTINASLGVSQLPLLNAQVTANPVTGCNGNANGSIAFSSPTGGSGTYRYSIDNGLSWSANPTFTNLPQGTYQVRIGDAINTGCSVLLNNR